MESERKRRILKIVLAVLGFSVAVIIWGYAELTDSSPPHPFNLPLWTAFTVLCPTSLLAVPLIDVEPGSISFAVVWFVIGLLNSGIYWLVGAAIGRLKWKAEPKAPAAP